FRAFDFLQGPSKDTALVSLVIGQPTADAMRNQLVRLESIKRLKGIDLSKHPQLAEAVEQLLVRTKDATVFVELVAQFSAAKHYPALLDIARKNAGEQIGLNALRLLFDKGQQGLVSEGLNHKDTKLVLDLLQALATTADERALPLLVK